MIGLYLSSAYLPDLVYVPPNTEIKDFREGIATDEGVRTMRSSLLHQSAIDGLHPFC